MLQAVISRVITRVDAIELSLALFNLALAKTMVKKKNCIIARNQTLSKMHKALSTMKDFKMVDMDKGYKAEIKNNRIRVEIFRIK